MTGTRKWEVAAKWPAPRAVRSGFSGIVSPFPSGALVGLTPKRKGDPPTHSFKGGLAIEPKQVQIIPDPYNFIHIFLISWYIHPLKCNFRRTQEWAFFEIMNHRGLDGFRISPAPLPTKQRQLCQLGARLLAYVLCVWVLLSLFAISFTEDGHGWYKRIIRKRRRRARIQTALQHFAPRSLFWPNRPDYCCADGVHRQVGL